MSADDRVEMDRESLERAYAAERAEPGRAEVLSRFRWAWRRTGGDPSLALAAVNEVLPRPLGYCEFLARYVGAA